jgi:hypothetical protein
MNTNSSSMSGLLDRVVDAHRGLKRWLEVRYLDVRLSISGGLYNIKGHQEGFHDVIMRIDVQQPAVTVAPSGVVSSFVCSGCFCSVEDES